MLFVLYLRDNRRINTYRTSIVDGAARGVNTPRPDYALRQKPARKPDKPISPNPQVTIARILRRCASE
jgi:hypothetical protein